MQLLLQGADLGDHVAFSLTVLWRGFRSASTIFIGLDSIFWRGSRSRLGLLYIPG